MKNYCVVTTVNSPTKAIEVLHEKFGQNLIVVGDVKTPEDWVGNENYYSIAYQSQLGFSSTQNIPYNHYARKNIGYLQAMKCGAESIFSSDDDNLPNENWKLRENEIWINYSLGEGWYNVYDLVSNDFIWPRGYSLRELRKYPTYDNSKYLRRSSIQQGLADGAPDVDAIWRLVLNKEIFFRKDMNVMLRPKTWCPFNTQSTWFFKNAFPLMYLPVTASMRMTDIYSSFVGQRCLWEIGDGVTFHSPSEVFQDRNEHDLMKDFADEVHGYLNVDDIVDLLGKLILPKGQEYMCGNLLTCYEAICYNNILPMAELNSVKAWIKDYENITRNME